jgi:hypothetical protein
MTVRNACLDRKLQGLSALVDVLGGADSATLEKAAPAAAGLSSLEVCADVPALLAEVPPPGDPVLRDRITAIRAQLARADALRLAGRFAEADTIAAKSVAEARATNTPTIQAEALVQYGRVLLKVDPGRAAQPLTDAFWAAFASRMDRVSIAAAIHATHAFALTLHFDQSELWEKYARAGLTRIGGDDELEAELWSALGMRYFEQRKNAEQITAFAQAARLSERRFGFDDLRTINAQQNELTGLANDDRVLDSWRLRVPLLARQEALLGPKHPALGRSLMDLGDDEVRVGRLADARTHLMRAEELFRDAGATSSRYWEALREYQLRLSLAEGRLVEAEAEGKEAVQLLASFKMGESESALYARVLLAEIERRRGHLGEATAMLTRELARSERVFGKDSIVVGIVLAFLSKVDVQAGRLAEGRQAAERNLALAIGHAGPNSYAAAQARIALAQVWVAAGDAQKALALVDENEPALVRAVGEDAPDVADARRTRGEALAALGRFGDAATALQAAVTIADRIGLDPSECKKTRAELDRALAKSGTKAHPLAAQ